MSAASEYAQKVQALKEAVRNRPEREFPAKVQGQSVRAYVDGEGDLALAVGGHVLAITKADAMILRTFIQNTFTPDNPGN